MQPRVLASRGLLLSVTLLSSPSPSPSPYHFLKLRPPKTDSALTPFAFRLLVSFSEIFSIE